MKKNCLILFILVCADKWCYGNAAIDGGEGEEDKEDNNHNNNDYSERINWYKRYPAYPEYCSNDSQMQERTIPPLNLNTTGTSIPEARLRLLHVTALIRHGARTPYNDHTCWPGYEDHGWDCELKTLTNPPAPPEINLLEEEGDEAFASEATSEAEDNVQLNGDGAMFMFEKNYDALHDPPMLRNILNGTCQMGQLLLRGYVQELHNGKMLRKMYVKEKDEKSNTDGNGNLNGNGNGDGNDNNYNILFDLNDDEYKNRRKPYEEPNLYYRADDDQRTIMSGQALLRGLFGDLIQQHSQELGSLVDPTIVVHTADRPRDILSPNKVVCPRLTDLYQEATESDEYMRLYVNSKESKALNQFMNDNFGGDFRDQAQDCLMTTICNDRELPQLLDDYSRGGDDYFERLAKYSFQPLTYVLRHNDAAYSKLALGPLWMNILSNMIPSFPIDAWKELIPELEFAKKEISPKLALFSGHDGTLLPLLATLGENVYNGEDWSPYASMILIELYSVETDGDADTDTDEDDIYPTNRAFRLVYNGDILTDKIEGCTRNVELCDITHLLRRVAPFTTNKRDCDSKLDDNESSPSPSPSTASSIEGLLFGSWRGVATLLSIVIGSFAIGSMVTFGLMTGRLRCILFNMNIIPDKFRPYIKANSQNHGDSLTNYSLQQHGQEHDHDLNLEESTLDYGSADSSLRPNANAVAT